MKTKISLWMCTAILYCGFVLTDTPENLSRKQIVPLITDVLSSLAEKVR